MFNNAYCKRITDQTGQISQPLCIYTQNVNLFLNYSILCPGTFNPVLTLCTKILVHIKHNLTALSFPNLGKQSSNVYTNEKCKLDAGTPTQILCLTSKMEEEKKNNWLEGGLSFLTDLVFCIFLYYVHALNQLKKTCKPNIMLGHCV